MSDECKAHPDFKRTFRRAKARAQDADLLQHTRVCYACEGVGNDQIPIQLVVVSDGKLFYEGVQGIILLPQLCHQ